MRKTPKADSLPNEALALKQIAKALRNYEPKDRERIIKAAAILLDIPITW